jgi:hypothetical protein
MISQLYDQAADQMPDQHPYAGCTCCADQGIDVCQDCGGEGCWTCGYNGVVPCPDCWGS